MKDKLYSDLLHLLGLKRLKLQPSEILSFGERLVKTLRGVLWYIDGHHQTFADRSHPIPSLFKSFVGYNTPELSKHRKRSHTNMSSDTLMKHALGLKTFLLSPWMKRPVWDTAKKGIEDLTEAIESYCFHLDEKNKAVKIL